MEQPPGSLDDIQPEDLSASSIPTVIDLTRKGDLNATSLDALQVIKSPGWYPNSETSSPGLPSSEADSSDVTLQSADQIQPDNAFSHTTVTLSYVSRSHVYPAPNSLSGHSPLYGVPPINKFSLRSPCEAEEGLGESGYALNQHYFEHVDGPVDLATQTELFHSSAQAQVVLESDGACLPQQPCEFNGGGLSSDGDTPLQVREEYSLSQETENSGGPENCQGDSWSSSGVCAESSPETLTSVTGKDESSGVSEVFFVMSKNQEPVVIPDNMGARELCSLNRQYRSPLEDPVSPSATSLDDVEDVFVLPQASSSPSGDNSLPEAADEVAWDGSSTEKAVQLNSGTNSTTRLDSCHENMQPVQRRKAVLEPLIDLTNDGCLSDVSEEKTVIPHLNGSASALQRTFREKKLPVRPGRGRRLEAIVMNINSSRYKVSGCIRTSKNAKASLTTARNSNLASPKRKDGLSESKGRRRAKASFSAKTIKQRTSLKRGKTNSINTDSCKESTSDSEINHSQRSHSSMPPKSPQVALHERSKSKLQRRRTSQISPTEAKRKPSPASSPQLAVCKKSKKEPEHPSRPDPSLEIHVARFSSPPPPKKSPKKSPGSAKGKAAGRKTSPAAKTKAARTPKRRRKKHKRSQSTSMFSPKEPEIKLKYVHYKEEKRDLKLDSFSPFIRVEHQQSSPSLCTVFNYPEEVRTQRKKGQQQQGHPGGFISAAVPSTSCLQLGRLSTHSQHQRTLVCCLCGLSANAMDLGDLHGPYFPEGYRRIPSNKAPACTSGLKEDKDDYSDSDSSSCSIRGRGRKCAVPPTSWPLRPPLKKKGPPRCQQWTSDNAGSPAAKRARSETWTADAEDWYSPPVVPLEPCEYWLHEDCGIWSAGVFLVKGKVYGLEEAVKVAQETICSACCDAGATLGCFFKGCPNKYHYRCALESDCVLIEENFSMKCKKHKNKTFKAPAGKQRADR